ncbi:MAG TPA: SDR family oxidoreductase [Deltaproteobacteria bacterium]|nr:SDR family oxidoreductase [Deltaproteobacteria bacterium]
MKLNFQRALVTGGAGFIGSHLVEALIENKCDVVVLDNLSSGNPSNLLPFKDRITFKEGDIRDRDMLSKAACGCDAVFHLAAVVSVPQTVEEPVDSAMVNDIGTLFVLEAARTLNIKRVVLSSSCAVYGDDPELPKNESMNVKPLSPYGVQKLNGEHYARIYCDLYGVKTACLRYFNVFGPRQDPSSPYSGVISIFMTKSINAETPVIFGDGNQSRDFVFVKDVVRANLLAANNDRAAGLVFNVGTGRSMTINELWRLTSGLSGFHGEPTHLDSRPGDIYASLGDTRRAESDLGFKAEYDFEQGLALTFQWYKNTMTPEGHL